MSSYIATTPLQRQQNKLSINLVNYDLHTQWNSHEIVQQLRSRIFSMMPPGLFDPQDLEHQVLFRLTTFDPTTITDLVIQQVIKEQLAIITHRLEPIKDKLPYLFRGLTGLSKDLNGSKRLELKHSNGELYATGHGCRFEVDFKKITDPEIVELFTEKLHYIHSARHKGDVFGFFFKGDILPWGVETVEPSIIAKQYKRDALLAHGVDPNKAVEITRLYLLPGSPTNAISILDGLVARHYKEQGLEAMFTTTMPTYAKTKGATTAGGMKDVLLVKELSHRFRPTTINENEYYVHDVSAKDAQSDRAIITHSAFPTLYTVETFMRLNKNRDIQPLPQLKNRTIYIGNGKRTNSTVIREAKFKINNIENCLDLLRSHTQYECTAYLSDQFWGQQDKPKLRLRKTDTGNELKIDVSRKYRVSTEPHVRSEITETLYSGPSESQAVAAIRDQGSYSLENSYEKIRMTYMSPGVELRLDIYPFGAYLEIAGNDVAIWSIADQLGFGKGDSITKNADETYLAWNTLKGLKELWHIRFGLSEGYEKEREK